jgi:D-sedoheptulose 7-phosphate isomerase
MKFFAEYFARIGACVERVDLTALGSAKQALAATRQRNGKVILAGNGGSAAIASHVAVDLTKVAGIRAINFNEADLITCFANDYGYEHWVERSLEFYADTVDLVVLISSSGRSPNIVNGARKARQMSLPLLTLSGFDAANPLRQLGDVNLWAPSDVYNVVEMTHYIWLLSLVDNLAGDRAAVA